MKEIVDTWETVKALSSMEEFNGQYWFFQLLVWLDFLGDPIPTTVIETGTHHGWGSVRWATFFEKVHTVELSKELYDSTRKKYNSFDNISFYNNSSPAFLKELLPSINDRCIIFLDAHYSWGDTVYDSNYGHDGTPIIDELIAIREYSKINDHIIIIDDCDDLGTSKYPTKKEVNDVLLTINSDYNVELDVPKHLLMGRGTGIAYS
jgi:hypothetical protein